MNVYRERSHLVAFLSACYPSHWITDESEPDWPVLVVAAPTGQMTWHISKDDLDLFKHVPSSTSGRDWDGHTTEEKYRRLATLTEMLDYVS